jgi:sugar/nucleoside kinase (ribokinase family)
MSRKTIVTVFGDLNYELVTDLDTGTFVDIRRDTLIYRPIGMSVGGTAANFALASLDHFSHVQVIGRVGADILGQMVMDRLARAGIQTHCVVDAGAPTGLGIYLRDCSSSHYKGVRLLIQQADSANHNLEPKDIDRNADVLRRSDLVVLDGYCFLKQPRRDASFRAMETAHSRAIQVAVDVVPHDAYELYEFNFLKSIAELATILICEVRTIRRFIGLDAPEQILDLGLALETAQLLRSEFTDKTFILRFGIGNIDQSLLCSPGREPQHSFTGYDRSNAARGFGDWLTARELSALLRKP